MRLTEKQKESLRNNNLESNRVTRESIRGALYLLMEKKAYEEITMTDIIRRSGVSRSALYRNYKTKEDILRDIVDDFTAQFVVRQTSSLHRNWSFAFQFFLENRQSLEVILRAGMEHILLGRINENLCYAPGAPDLVQAMNNGLIFNVLMYWARCGMAQEPEEAADRIVEAFKRMVSDVSRQY